MRMRDAIGWGLFFWLTASFGIAGAGESQIEIKRGNDVLSYPVGLNAKMASIGRVVAGADARPPDSSYEAFDQLSVALDAQLAKWRDVLQTDVAAFNEMLYEKRVPAISIEGGR